MPVDRTIAADTGEQIIRLYTAVEARIVAEVRRRLAAGIDAPTWAATKLAGAQDLRTWTRRLLAGLDDETRRDVTAAMLAAAGEGQRLALADIEAAAARDPRLHRLLEAARAATAAGRELPGAGAINVIAAHLADTLRSAATPVLRWVDDAYREVIAAGAAPDVLSGVLTRRKASEAAWNRLLGQGITGFIDRAGRRWQLSTYVEMATRTTTAQAAVEAHLGRLAGLGLDLVIVSDVAGECELCRPWEGKVLARTGASGARTVHVEHATRDGVTVAVHVAGTVTEAMAAGLLHPNCRHSLSAYLPGLTRIPTGTADPAGDAARQQLRALERRVRRHKVQAVGALTPEGKTAALAKVRAAQADIRAHVAATAHLGISRQPHREQINLGNRRDHIPAIEPITPTLPHNPAELTGQDRQWWDPIVADTADTPIPVRDLTLHAGYVVRAGQAHRIDGVTYLIEDGSPRYAGIHDPLTELRRFHASLPASRRDEQRAYAWLAGPYRHETPGFTTYATNLDQATQVYRPLAGEPIDQIGEALNHEFGHTVSTAAAEHRGGKLGRSETWDVASEADTATIAARLPRDISWRQGLFHVPDPPGVTAYGRTDTEEDFAESVYLYLAGAIGTGTLKPGGRRVAVYFRDLWPARAAILDRLFPDVAERQKAAINGR